MLTGADHLSALATLAVGSRFKAFSLGIRWGLGHSTGLIVVAGVLLGLGDGVNAKKLEHYWWVWQCNAMGPSMACCVPCSSLLRISY